MKAFSRRIGVAPVSDFQSPALAEVFLVSRMVGRWRVSFLNMETGATPVQRQEVRQ